LLVNDGMGAVEVKLKSNFSDQTWCKVKIKNGEELLIGVCYHSPNPEFSSKDNNKMLCEMLEEVRGKPVLLMGDFNYPDIDWSTSQAHTPASQSFVDSIEDSFLTQHVREGTCNRAVLDLVVTSEPDMIDKVTVKGNLGNSDHSMLEWEVHLSPVLSSLFNHPGFNYALADFPALRHALRQTDWSLVLQGDANDK